MDGMAEILGQVVQWVWQATWRASVLIGLVLAIRVLVGRWVSPKWTYALWLLVVVRLLLPFGPASSMSLFNLFPHKAAESTPLPSGTVPAAPPVTDGRTSTMEGLAVVYGQGPTTEGSDLHPKQDRMTLITILPWIWLVGALALAVYIGVCHVRLWRIIRFERAVIQSTALGVLDRCRARMRIGTLLGVVLTDQVQTPALFGLVRPRLLIPATMSQRVTARELRHVFLHELAHLKHHDVAVGWLVAICQVLHWFNPLVWMALHQMRADRELACDELAMSYMAGSRDTQRYGQTLIRLQEVLGPSRPVASLACIVEARSQLKARIERIVNSDRSQPWHSVMAGILLLLVGIVGLTDATIDVAERPILSSPELVDSDTGPEIERDMPIGRADVMEPSVAEGKPSDVRPATEDPRSLEDRIEVNGMSDTDLPSSLWSRVFLYYDFEEVRGKQAIDLSPTGHHGMIHGDPVSVQGILGRALSFDGQDDFVTVEAMPIQTFTVCQWVRSDQAEQGRYRRVLIFVGPQTQMEIGIDGLGGMEWRTRTGPGSESTGRVHWTTDTGDWLHVAVTCDRGEVRLYLDGIRMDNRAIHWNPSSQFLHIGGGSYWGWQGLIDEVVVFAEALHAEQVAQIVSRVKPVERDSEGEARTQQNFWRQGQAGGFPPSQGFSLELQRTRARSTIGQLGQCVEMITGQWAPNIYGGDWRRANMMVTPLRMLRTQLQAASDTGEIPFLPEEANFPEALRLAPRSVAQAVEVLAQTPDTSLQAQEVMTNMEGVVDQIIKAVGTRDRISLQAGCTRLRQTYQELLSVLGLDKDPTFQTLIRPSRPTVTRPPANRVRGRTVFRGR